MEGDGEGWGYSDADVRALLDPGFEPDDPAEAACFAFARAATRDPSDVPQAVISRMTEVLTPPQVIELACVVGFWRMYNSIHESLYVPVEDELLGGRDFNPDELLGEAETGGAPGPRPAVTVKVEIYTKAGCSFCRRAKRVLEGKGVVFTELRVDEDEVVLKTMIERSDGRRTVPQIFHRRRPRRRNGCHAGPRQGRSPGRQTRARMNRTCLIALTATVRPSATSR